MQAYAGEPQMKGHSTVNQQLNQVLRQLLTGINQYFLHARMAGNWGFDSHQKKDYDYSIDLMKAADKVTQRILFLEGLPNLQDLGKLYLGEDIAEIMSGNLRFELELRQGLVNAIALCESENDFISRACLTHILHESEEQIDWLEAQQHLIKETGLQNYLQSAM